MTLKESLSKYLGNDEIEALLESMEKERTHALLLNTNKMSDGEFVARYPDVKAHPFVPHAYLYDKNEYEFGKDIFYDCGVYSIQDPSAMMVPFFLNPKPGEIVLDMCAAPGGKTIGMSLMMNGEGAILSNDASYPRAKELSSNVERMGLGNVIVNSSDFVFAYNRFEGNFDKILVDAPCSGTAMFRKNEEAEKDWSEKKVIACAKRQLELLEEAYFMLKPGGTLCYSTCSFSYEEDEGVMLEFKLRHPDIEFIDLPHHHTFRRGHDVPQSVYFFPYLFEGEGQYVAMFKKPGELIYDKKETVVNMKYRQFIAKYGLQDRSNEAMKEKLFSMSQKIIVNHLNILRYGVKLFELKDIFIPDHHLAHFLPASYSYPLDRDTMIKYVRGETFPIDHEDGFLIVSYENQNLGWIKVTKGVAKNHYPKGLRREIK